MKSDVPYAVSLPLSRRVKRGIGGNNITRVVKKVDSIVLVETKVNSVWKIEKKTYVYVFNTYLFQLLNFCR